MAAAVQLALCLEFTVLGAASLHTGSGAPSFFFFFSFLFRLVPEAYGGSQARGQVGAAAAGLHHSNARSKPVCDLYHSPWQLWI